MKELFGKVNNLEGFIHSKFKQDFKFMNERESIDLAKTVLEKFKKTRIKNIVVIESGTSPLIELIKMLPEYHECDFNIKQIKIPRDLDFDLLGWFKEYLTNDEYKNREKELKRLVANFSFQDFIGNKKFTIYDSIKGDNGYLKETEFQSVLKGTELEQIFSSQFLVFDEYINAGTIIRNLNGIVKLFTNNKDYKLSSYCMFLDHPDDYSKIAFTLYSNESELECYQKGAYPFENRIDLIGYYFFIDNKNFEKVYMGDLYEEVKSNTKDVSKIFTKFNELIDKNNLVSKLKNNMELECVANYVDNTDIIYYILKDMEEQLYGKSKYSDFYDQVYELYAPAWSPMPVVNHLTYWEGFSRTKDDISCIYEEVKDDYSLYRWDILNYVLKKLINSHDEWMKRIMEEMNK